MRFVLDQDVDARVRSILLEAGHEAWTAHEAGLSEANDDALTAYAQSKGAVLVSHDREFSTRRMRFPIGRHLYLAGDDTKAREIVSEHLAEIVPAFGPFDDICVRASVDGVASHTRWGGPTSRSTDGAPGEPHAT